MSQTADNVDEYTPDQVRQLETANRLKAEFISNVSHELRTPVHAIIGYAELLTDGVYGAMSDEQEQTVQFIRDSAQDLLSLVNNLLDLSKIESGKSDLILNTFDLRDLISELCGQLKSLADAKRLILDSKVMVEDPVIRTDRGKLKQVLVNLVGNAMKFTETGKVTIVVSTPTEPSAHTSMPHSQRLLVSVHDTGVGMPSEQLGKIFEKFYQVNGSTSRSHEGTGLGLYIVKQLVDLLAATIDVKSTVGKGTTVSISLPKNYQEVDVIQRLRKRIATASAASTDETVNGKRLVLVVSDSPDISRILADGLGSSEYAVRTTPATSDAIGLAIKLHPLVILLNAENSSSEFWSVFQELKTQPQTKDIPTIFLSNDSTHGLGAPLAVAAPLNPRDVLRSVRAATSAGHKNVLIVDDEESFRDVLKLALSEEGYNITEATNGKDAIKQLNESKPDLLLLDLNIPEIDGWGVIRHITQNAQLKDMEVLVISGDVLNKRETAEIQANDVNFISKGNFKVNTILEQVASLLEVK